MAKPKPPKARALKPKRKKPPPLPVYRCPYQPYNGPVEKPPGPPTFRPGDLADPELVSGRLDTLAREVRDGFAMMSEKILPAITRVESKIDDAILRIGDLERHQRETDTRLSALEARLSKEG